MLVPVGCGVAIADREMISTQQYEEVLEWFYHRSKTTTVEAAASLPFSLTSIKDL